MMENLQVAIINWGAEDDLIRMIEEAMYEGQSLYERSLQITKMDFDYAANLTKPLYVVLKEPHAVVLVIGNKTLHRFAKQDYCDGQKHDMLLNLYHMYHKRYLFIVTESNWEYYLVHHYCMDIYSIVRRCYVPFEKIGHFIVHDFHIGQPTSRPNGRYKEEFETNESNSFASVFAPQKAKVGDYLLIQVYIYKDSDHNIIVETAKRSDDNKTQERQQVLLDYNINKGDIIDVTINLYNLPSKAQIKEAIWSKKYAYSSFYVNIPSDFKYDKLYAEVLLSVNEATICQMNFATNIIKKSKKKNDMFGSWLFQIEQKRELARITSRCFKKVFVSYSHKDADKVKFLAEAYRAIGVDYFYDRHSLQGGDVFDEKIQDAIQTSDLFILCWSENAAQSNYIQKEIETALPLAYPQFKPQEAAPLSIYPISIEPSAPPPENLKSIYNFVKI